MSFKIGDREVGYDHPPYIIADACNNFNGDINAAYDLCEQAKDVGCDAIKFQMRIRPDRISPGAHAEIADYCRQIGITWLCSAFDSKGFSYVEGIGVPAHKIPSGEVTNRDLVKEVCEMNRPVIASVGMCSEMETWDVERVLNLNATAYAILQCTSIYPTPYDKVRLGFVDSLRGCLSTTTVGLSDHTPTIWTAIGAVALGACIIEKHITKNVNGEGPDHASSITPTRFHALVEGCNAVWQARGSRKEFFPEEMEKAKQHKWGVRP